VTTSGCKRTYGYVPSTDFLKLLLASKRANDYWYSSSEKQRVSHLVGMSRTTSLSAINFGARFQPRTTFDRTSNLGPVGRFTSQPLTHSVLAPVEVSVLGFIPLYTGITVSLRKLVVLQSKLFLAKAPSSLHCEYYEPTVFGTKQAVVHDQGKGVEATELAAMRQEM
jgi:hypothetical protein